MKLVEQLRRHARERADELFLIDAEGSLTYGQALQAVDTVAEKLQPVSGKQLFLLGPDSIRLLVALVAADAVNATTCVLNAQFSTSEVREVLARLGNGHLLTTSPDPDFGTHAVYNLNELVSFPVADAPGATAQVPDRQSKTTAKIIVLTSGTTGRPKAAVHTWERLLGQVRHTDEREPAAWLLAYPINHFAGLQVFLHCLVNRQRLIIPDSRQFFDILRAVHSNGVSAISATPTFWRFLIGRLSADASQGMELTQITLGGEPSTGELLAKLRSLFPRATIRQIYATTELGSCFSVQDGLPGFPQAFLERPVGNVRLKIIDDELYVQVAHATLGYAGGTQMLHSENGWVATGDLVEIVGDRVLFRGRKAEIINVGGVKVYPPKVEEAILGIAGVVAARVYGKVNPITGQIVAAEVELREGADPHATKKAIAETCRQILNRYEQPREIIVTNAIGRRNEKIVRS